ncbi:coatomer subunit epsilon [Brachionus plicatilis]|uniref:Coatomer subunit epsilon n=1 Tax=Brachionus plicatilis TaxID=10195 RepID=A0A3M7Q0C7_BRAPC|nr:coatomer subunit epsilon [Brachionus plicatilis]
MHKDNSADELFDLKTSFYLGNYQQAVTEAQKLRVSEPVTQAEKDVYMYRAFIAQKKYGVVLDDIKPNASDELKFVRLMAEYLSNESRRDAIIDELDSKLASLNITNPLVLLVIANIYVLHDNLETALKLLHNCDSCQLLECGALAIQIYLKMDRHDLARKELKKLIDMDEDAIITQLAGAWVYMATGDKIQDAYFTFQEQADKNSATSLLLNNQALCQINQEKFDEAQSLLQEALDKDSNNADAMVNSIVLNQHLGKPVEVTNRFISQLKDSSKNHPFVKDLLLKESEFNRIAQHYHPSK